MLSSLAHDTPPNGGLEITDDDDDFVALLPGTNDVMTVSGGGPDDIGNGDNSLYCPAGRVRNAAVCTVGVLVAVAIVALSLPSSNKRYEAPTASPVASNGSSPMPTPSQAPSSGTDTTNYCGTTWTDAANECSHTCPRGIDSECPEGTMCFGGITSCSNMADDDGVIRYTCPSTVKTSMNDKKKSFQNYLKDDEEHANKTLADFRSMPLDGWGVPYGTVKTLLRPWKEEVFVPNVKSGNAIYESACGIGLNLLLTAEILRENVIGNVTVYGSDYVPESVDLANKVWDDDGATQVARKGRFCRGDSANLDFVPSAAFDLVYTGYIEPINDPLGLVDTDQLGEHDNCWEQSMKFCDSTDAEEKLLAEKEQLAQEEWYNRWVTELIRIAKPGKVIAVENGARPLCQDTEDWGGVGKSWWSEAVSRYGWDVDPESIVIRDGELVDEWDSIRYHVMMRKNY